MNPLRPSEKLPRLVSDEPFPPYSYVTGLAPHPTRDPAGHGFGHAIARPSPLVPERFQESRPYLFACDLFNHGYYWESHEVWEGLWQACGRRGATADFLKGLIKLAAAGVKAREGRAAGVSRHAQRAAELFRAVRDVVNRSDYLGQDLDQLIAIATTLTPGVAIDRTAKVQIMFDFQLRPKL